VAAEEHMLACKATDEWGEYVACQSAVVFTVRSVQTFRPAHSCFCPASHHPRAPNSDLVATLTALSCFRPQFLGHYASLTKLYLPKTSLRSGGGSTRTRPSCTVTANAARRLVRSVSSVAHAC
jgi:hypothetical protein